ncbi:MAG: histidine kinase N-terminal domain-containing protein [Anaerolineae bacterium]|nr:histidine kinase N-terminal domain-containing protein [Anaerolineae bacterium]
MKSAGVFWRLDLAPGDVVLLKKIAADLPILADLCRSDLIMFCQAGAEQVIVLAQALAHSSSPVYETSLVGSRSAFELEPGVAEGLRGRSSHRMVYTTYLRGATIARQVHPIRNERGQTIAVLVQDAYWLAHERQRRRSKAFQSALQDFIAMVLRGELRGAEELTPFGGSDGIMYVGADYRIAYMSGIASELYRQLGFRDSLVGRQVGELDTVDHEMVTQAMLQGRCLERQVEQDGLTWIRKAVPINAKAGSWRDVFRRGPARPGGDREVVSRGAFVLIHDATERLRTERELESKAALVRDMHHRVKNNLQVIASIMGMQASRAQSDEARAVLQESIGRVLSVAVVHEFLSHNAQGLINLKEVAHRILVQTQASLIHPDKVIQLDLGGADIWLPAERATQCALVINELVQNAIEHGMQGRQAGTVRVALVDDGAEIEIDVSDDGEGLPQGFELERDADLGLRIVQSMVSRDLKGHIELLRDGNLTRAVVRFGKPKGGGS